jgi:hypothetical protein
MSQPIEPEQTHGSELVSTPTNSLAQIWAKKYVADLQVNTQEQAPAGYLDVENVVSLKGRTNTTEKLNQALRFTSAQAWAKTETLLVKEVQRHRIDPDLIDPWRIAEDTRHLFNQTLRVYTEQAPPRQVSILMELPEPAHAVYSTVLEELTDLPTPGQLSVVLAPEVGKIRQKYTAHDPRVLGFVSMQFHYSGQMLLELLSPLEQNLVGSYFKVIDDHLYMPLHRSYEAAAEHEYNSPALLAVQQLLPISSEIARSVCQRISEMYPAYRSYSGSLSSPPVKVSSIRDVEMFQVYLCLCVLEGKIAALQEELFPLCVMLYPPLQVRWELVRHMLRLLGQEISERLGPNHAGVFQSASRALWEMFSLEVLAD